MNFSKERIENGLGLICEDIKVPKELDLSLIEGAYNLKSDDDELLALAQEAHQHARNYVIEATVPSETNEETARILADVVNNYAKSGLHENEENFWGDIVYKNEEGIYVFAE